jgi:phage shock protein E
MRSITLAKMGIRKSLLLLRCSMYRGSLQEMQAFACDETCSLWRQGDLRIIRAGRKPQEFPMRLSLIPVLALSLSTALPAAGQVAPQASAQPGSPLIDYDGYLDLTREVRPYRQQRLLPLDDFRKQAGKKKALLLDARSAQAFREGHIKGAVNLPLPDFNAASLAKLIGKDTDRPIYIYCNNNFSDNRRPVPTKSFTLALNPQTFINLYGYGYKNVWELADAVKMADPAVGWAKGKMTPKGG